LLQRVRDPVPIRVHGYCTAAEEYGYDVVFTTDHLGSPAPFPPLVAAAAATRRLRVGTLVLNVGF
jgi:alkanesulfonate monooxygenase SsuD/methylene tetrahydromethanopterin reductase-like flavin-dependent oxidoreductase (luciferase family)